jgi:hypothetical protein
VTDNLSGCAIYIGKRTDGELVVFHSNSQTDSNAAIMSIRLPSYQSPTALQELDGHVQGAKPHHANNVQIVAVLTKLSYLSNVDASAATGADFLAGTTVAGWRKGGNWEFWYQNWGSVNGSGAKLLKAKKFYG